MSRRWIAAALPGLALTLVHARDALAHGGEARPSIFSGESVFPALMTSLVTGLICYALMVWDPKGGRH
jgi:hypothetical protein